MRARNGETGLTLLEVLVSLAITAVITVLVLDQATAHFRLTKNVQEDSEACFALLRAGEVLASAVKNSEKVDWNGYALTVVYVLEQKRFTDLYYVSDKDFDGCKDLYREHLGVPNPVVSGITGLHCAESGENLWQIRIEAAQGQKVKVWDRKVRQWLRTSV